MDKKVVTITLSEKRIFNTLLLSAVAFEVFLVLLDAFVNYGKLIDIAPIRRFANIAREDGYATWFASTQTLFAGLTAMLVYMLSKKLKKTVKQNLGWLITALFFIYMAMDDGAQIHERMGSAFKILAERNDGGILSSVLSISPSYPWQLIFVPIFGFIGLYMSYFLWVNLNESRMRLLMFLALAAMGFAVGLDFFEGLDDAHPWNIYTLIRDYFDVRSYTVWHFAKVMEEFLEMLSITLFWVVFSRHMLYLMRSVDLKIGTRV